MEQSFFVITLLLNIGIISLVVYAIYATIKLIKKHFSLLDNIQQQVEAICQKMDQLNR